jgi:hypothetical protein
MGFRALVVNGDKQVPFRALRLGQTACKFFHAFRSLVPPSNVAFDK